MAYKKSGELFYNATNKQDNLIKVYLLKCYNTKDLILEKRL